MTYGSSTFAPNLCLGGPWAKSSWKKSDVPSHEIYLHVAPFVWKIASHPRWSSNLQIPRYPVNPRNSPEITSLKSVQKNITTTETLLPCISPLPLTTEDLGHVSVVSILLDILPKNGMVILYINICFLSKSTHQPSILSIFNYPYSSQLDSITILWHIFLWPKHPVNHQWLMVFIPAKVATGPTCFGSTRRTSRGLGRFGHRPDWWTDGWMGVSWLNNG